MGNLKYFIQLGIPPCLFFHPDHPVSHRDHQGDPGSVSLKLSIALLACLKKILRSGVQMEVAHSTPSGFSCRIVSNKPAVKRIKKILHWNWCTDKSSSFYTNNGSSCRIASNRPAGWEADEKEQQALGVCLIYECSNRTFVFVFIFVPVFVFVFAFLFVFVRIWIVGQGPGVWSTSVLTTPGFLVVAVEGCIAHGPPPSKQLAAPAFNGTGRQTFREIVHPGDEITPCCKQSSGGTFSFRSDRVQASNLVIATWFWLDCLFVGNQARGIWQRHSIQGLVHSECGRNAINHFQWLALNSGEGAGAKKANTQIWFTQPMFIGGKETR